MAVNWDKLKQTTLLPSIITKKKKHSTTAFTEEDKIKHLTTDEWRIIHKWVFGNVTRLPVIEIIDKLGHELSQYSLEEYKRGI